MQRGTDVVTPPPPSLYFREEAVAQVKVEDGQMQGRQVRQGTTAAVYPWHSIIQTTTHRGGHLLPQVRVSRRARHHTRTVHWGSATASASSGRAQTTPLPQEQEALFASSSFLSQRG